MGGSRVCAAGGPGTCRSQKNKDDSCIVWCNDYMTDQPTDRTIEHYCDFPPLAYLPPGTGWECPICHKKYSKTFDADEDVAYWDLDD